MINRTLPQQNSVYKYAFIAEREEHYGEFLGELRQGEPYPVEWEGRTLKMTAFPPYSLIDYLDGETQEQTYLFFGEDYA